MQHTISQRQIFLLDIFKNPSSKAKLQPGKAELCTVILNGINLKATDRRIVDIIYAKKFETPQG